MTTFEGTKGFSLTMLVVTIPSECPMAASLSQGRRRRRSQRGQAVGKRMMPSPRGGLSHAAPALSLQLLPPSSHTTLKPCPNMRYGIFNTLYLLFQPSHTTQRLWHCDDGLTFTSERGGRNSW